MSKELALIIGFIILIIIGLIPIGLSYLIWKSSDEDEVQIKKVAFGYAFRAIVLIGLVIPFFIFFKSKRTIIMIILLLGEVANITLFRLRK